MLKLFSKSSQDKEIAQLKKELELKNDRIDQLVRENAEMKKATKLKEQEAKRRVGLREELLAAYARRVENALDDKTREVDALKKMVDEQDDLIVKALKKFSDMEKALNNCGNNNENSVQDGLKTN